MIFLEIIGLRFSLFNLVLEFQNVAIHYNNFLKISIFQCLFAYDLNVSPGSSGLSRSV